MKLQLDFTSKTITIEDNVNLGDFIKKMKVLLPDLLEWTLITNTIINNWSNPIYIERSLTYPRWDWAIGTCDSKTISETDRLIDRINGVYNVELN